MWTILKIVFIPDFLINQETLKSVLKNEIIILSLKKSGQRQKQNNEIAATYQNFPNPKKTHHKLIKKITSGKHNLYTTKIKSQ